METKYYFCVSIYPNITFKDNIENKNDISSLNVVVCFPQFMHCLVKESNVC